LVLARTTRNAADKHQDPSPSLGMTGWGELQTGNHRHAQKRLALLRDVRQYRPNLSGALQGVL